MSQERDNPDFMSDGLKMSSWNACFKTNVFVNSKIDDLKQISLKNSEKNSFEEYKVYTCAGIYTGGKSGLDHLWLLSGETQRIHCGSVFSYTKKLDLSLAFFFINKSKESIFIP